MFVHPRRTRGCAPPWSTEQVVATSAEVGFTAVTVAALSCLVAGAGSSSPAGGLSSFDISRANAGGVLAAYLIPSAILVAAWAYCVVVDPAMPVSAV